MKCIGILAAACITLITMSAVAPPASAEQPWWETCNELPPNQIEACFYEHNGESPPSERKPNRPAVPVRAHIDARYPGAKSVFINCPPQNVLGTEGDEIGCEFRLVVGHAAIRGFSAVAPEGELGAHWEVAAFHADAPAPLRWKDCSAARTARHPVSLEVYGTLCPEARNIASTISFRAAKGDLRIPNQFVEGEYQTNTRGFVGGLYRCRGRVRIVQPRSPDLFPYGREQATCRTRFGDRLTFVFDQAS